MNRLRRQLCYQARRNRYTIKPRIAIDYFSSNLPPPPRGLLGPPGGLLGASWGPPGGLRGGSCGPPGGCLGLLGSLLAPRPIFERFLVSFWGPKIVKIGAEICFKMEHRFGTSFWAIWRPLGLLWGSILGPFWGRFWAPKRRRQF